MSWILGSAIVGLIVLFVEGIMQSEQKPIAMKTILIGMLFCCIIILTCLIMIVTDFIIELSI